MLDEECLLPHGTDNGFVALLESQTQVNPGGVCLYGEYVGTFRKPRNPYLHMSAVAKSCLWRVLCVDVGVLCWAWSKHLKGRVLVSVGKRTRQNHCFRVEVTTYFVVFMFTYRLGFSGSISLFVVQSSLLWPPTVSSHEQHADTRQGLEG